MFITNAQRVDMVHNALNRTNVQKKHRLRSAGGRGRNWPKLICIDQSISIKI